MVLFEIFYSKKSDPNIHQNAPKCTIYKNFLGGACPQTPLAKRMASPCAACRFATCKFPNLKKKFLLPPLPNPGDAPVYVSTVCGYCMCLVGYSPPVLIIFFYKIYSLCKSNAISKALNKLQVFHFRSTVHTNTTPTVITHSCVLQKPPSCNDKGYKFE